ncbi:MAG: phosphate ABC transporter substrate-binding protein [Pseudomonadota bacterium]
MKREIHLIKAFGKNQYGLAEVPHKISGIQISRIVIGEESGCSFCFPHGYETINSHDVNRQRCWKRQRRTQWRLNKEKISR